MPQKMGWSLAAILVVFTLFVLASALVFFAWGDFQHFRGDRRRHFWDSRCRR
jgi:hypothetical protein